MQHTCVKGNSLRQPSGSMRESQRCCKIFYLSCKADSWQLGTAVASLVHDLECICRVFLVVPVKSNIQSARHLPAFHRPRCALYSNKKCQRNFTFIHANYFSDVSLTVRQLVLGRTDTLHDNMNRYPPIANLEST